MFTIRDRTISIMVMFAVAIHIFWAIILFIDDAALGVTAIDALHRFIKMPWLAWTLAAAGFMALLAMAGHSPGRTPQPWLIALLIPQQILLLMSFSGAIEAVWISQYADGVLRSRTFIAADQGWTFFACITHTVAIVAYAARIGRK